MPLNDDFPKGVAFVVGSRPDESGAQVQTAIGTAFFVALPVSNGSGGAFVYAVTAAHVVACETEAWLRVRSKSGSLGVAPATAWTIHPTADVAVALVVGPDQLDIKWITMENFCDFEPTRPALGDQVHFIGLLAIADSMVQENVPMVRSGALGRLYQQRVPLRRCDGTLAFTEAHLIDCRSYGGFSGSPCFVEYRVLPKPGRPASSSAVCLHFRRSVA